MKNSRMPLIDDLFRRRRGTELFDPTVARDGLRLNGFYLLHRLRA